MNAADAGRDHAGMHPMKKAKQAKRPARKVVRKKRQTKAQKAAQAEVELRASLRKSDPYYLDPKLIPVGWGYAWIVNQREGGVLPPGWGLVPYSRHAHDFPRRYQRGNFIVHDGLILAEALSDQIRAELHAPAKLARQMHDQHPASGRSEFGRIQIMPEDWVESEKISRSAYQNEGDPVEVEIDLVVRVPVRWRSAAEFLKLTLREYTRRRILMERPILGSMLRWDGQSDSEAIYEPVSLHFSAVNPPKES